jgi:hypothetical protein
MRSSTPTGERTDPLAETVTSVVACMRTDFAPQFRTAYPDGESIKLLKQRLYAKLQGFPLPCIVDGYEHSTRKGFMPNVAEIAENAKACHDDERRRQAAQIEARQTGQLPPPRQTAMTDSVLDLLRSALQARARPNDPEHHQQLDVKVAQHAALLQAHVQAGKIRRRRSYAAELKCAAEGCQQLGTVTSSVNGGGLWYCPDHARVHRELWG